MVLSQQLLPPLATAGQLWQSESDAHVLGHVEELLEPLPPDVFPPEVGPEPEPEPLSEPLELPLEACELPPSTKSLKEFPVPEVPVPHAAATTPNAIRPPSVGTKGDLIPMEFPPARESGRRGTRGLCRTVSPRRRDYEPRLEIAPDSGELL
jgi:hypothetical protein